MAKCQPSMAALAISGSSGKPVAGLAGLKGTCKAWPALWSPELACACHRNGGSCGWPSPVMASARNRKLSSSGPCGWPLSAGQLMKLWPGCQIGSENI